MKTGILSQLSPFNQLVFSLLLTLSSVLIIFFIAVLLAIPLFHVNLFINITLLSDYSNPVNIAMLKYLQIIQSFGLFIFPPLLAGYFFENNCLSFVRLNKSSTGIIYLITFALMFAALPLINWMVTVNEMMKLPVSLKGMEEWMQAAEQEAAKLTAVFLNVKSPGGFLVNMLMIAILPAIGEELMFRGLIQRLLKDWLKNIHVAVFISALLFAAMHLQFYGFLPRMALGVLFGYLFYWTGTLWVPIFAHFVNNAAAVIVSYMSQTGTIKGNYENFGSTENAGYLIASLAVGGILLFLIYRFRYLKLYR